MPYLIAGLIVIAVVPLTSLYLLIMGLGSLFTTVGNAEVEDDAEG